VIKKIILLFLLVSGCNATQPETPDFSLDKNEIKSGLIFMSAESQVLQADEFANPGILWAEKGAKLFSNPNSGKSCKTCHDEPETEFARPLSYPALDENTGALINLEGRINLCRTKNQALPKLDYESEDLLALTTYVKSLSRDKIITYEITEDLRPHFDAGKAYFYTRRGQLNLSCHQCHDQNWGKKMRGDTISQGHINGFPAYRNDWQTLGSAHRRFEACDIGVRAKPHPLGSQTYLELEVYLSARGNSLKSEVPAIRR